MGILKKKKIGKVLKSVGLGLLDTFLPIKGVIGGLFNGVKDVAKKNADDKHCGKGQIDWVRISVAVGTTIVILAFVFALGYL